MGWLWVVAAFMNTEALMTTEGTEEEELSYFI